MEKLIQDLELRIAAVKERGFQDLQALYEAGTPPPDALADPVSLRNQLCVANEDLEYWAPYFKSVDGSPDIADRAAIECRDRLIALVEEAYALLTVRRS